MNGPEKDNNLTDEEIVTLLKDAIKGDGDALNRLLAYERLLLRRRAGRLTSSEETASSIVQLTLLEASQKLDQLRAHTVPVLQKWLYTILANKLRARRGRRKSVNVNQPQEEFDLNNVSGAYLTPLEQMEIEASLADIQRRIGLLSHEQQQVIRMLVFDNQSQKDIAAELGITVEAVESRLTRARDTLRGLLDDENHE